MAAWRKGLTMSGLSALSYGAGAIFVRYAYQAEVLPGAAIFLRFAIAAGVLVLFLYVKGEWVSLPQRQTLAIFLLGFIGFSLMGTTFFVALSLIPAWLVALLTALIPLFTNLGSWLFLKEQMSGWQVSALVMVLGGGVFLFIQPFEEIVWPGILLMGLNIITVAIYLLVGQHWTRGVPPLMSAVWTVIGAACGTLFYALFVNELTFVFAPIGWLWALCIGIISTAFAIMAQWWGVGLIGAARASIMGSFEPLATVSLAVLILGERLSVLQLIGGAFIITGMFLVQRRPG